MTGIITDIQRFSVHDGPGIRTTVFLKGCNLRCAWCHNPETLRPRPEVQRFADKCIGCGACHGACPHGEPDSERCRDCGACARACYAEARVVAGREVSPGEVVCEALQDGPFYERSGGGVTLSGGEPLYQHAFACEVLDACRREGLHTAVETNLAWPWERVRALLPLVDLLMVDVKLLDPAAHAEWTGAPNGQVLENLARLGRERVPLVVRTPVVAGVNDAEGEIGGIAGRIAGFPNLRLYELLPYHPLGSGKYESLGLAPPSGLGCPDAETMRRLAAAATRAGVAVRVAGRPA